MYSETCVFHYFSTVYDKTSYDDDMCVLLFRLSFQNISFDLCTLDQNLTFFLV